MSVASRAYNETREPALARASRSEIVRSLAVLVAYACLSAAIFGREALPHLDRVVVGFGQEPGYYGRDQSAYVWFIAWGLHQIAHLHNPLSTTAIFAPFGYNLAWAASIQGPALLMSPVTALAGAVASFDVLALAAPAVAAWSAWLLCRYGLRRRLVPSLAGGLLFGFGTYETVEMINHVNLALVGLVPLVALLALLRHQGRISRPVYVAGLGVTLALQLWTSTEVLTSTIGFGVLALALTALLGGREQRGAVGGLALESLGGVVVAGALGSPFLYHAFSYPNPVEGLSSANNGADISNIVGPTRATWLSWLGLNAAHASGPEENLTEQAAYLGLPLLALLVAFVVGFRRGLAGRLLGCFIVIALILSMGDDLIAGGTHTGFPLPWGLFSGLPLLRYILPGRFAMYVWLGAALATALWLDRPSRGVARWALFALVALSLVPNVASVSWGTPVDRPALPSSPELARYVPPGDTVLALPYGINGDSMSWQVQAHFEFLMSGGYVSIGLPSQYVPHAHLLTALSGGPFRGEPLANLCAFLALTRTNVIMLREGTPGEWGRLLDPLRIGPTRVGGFYVYGLRPAFEPGGACRRAG